MIELLPGFPENVVAVRVHAKATKKDYDDVLIPSVQALNARDTKIRVYYELAGDFTGFELGALWDDVELGITYFSLWEKVAVVADAAWVRSAVEILRFMMPCPVKVFDLAHTGEAKQWIEGDDGV